MSDIEAFAGLVDLATASVGGRALITSDDFFAGVENLLNPKAAHFDPTTYTDRGKEMDGWESRRKRVPGHDWAILKLGVPGRIRGVDIDTSHFLGNHPPFSSIDACDMPDDTSPEVLRDQVEWTRILDVVPLKRGSHNLQPVAHTGRFSHLRLNIYPDGGVARLRVYGEPQPVIPEGEIDLAALVNGGRALACSDMFFSPMNNLLLPGRSKYMGGGWETRRSRPPGMDWIIVALCDAGNINRITLDTGHFKGNYPDRAAVDGLYWPGAPPNALPDHSDWTEILPPVKLHADDDRSFSVTSPGPFTHLRLRILPDGGVARMRVWGVRQAEVPADAAKLREKFAATAAWAAGEQAGMTGTDEATFQALAAGNTAYERRFANIFIVCATGLSAAEMLRRLHERLENEPAAELRIAAGEQAKITALRLLKLASA